MANELEISEFFESIYGDIPDNHHLLLWQISDKRSYWFTKIARAAEFAAKYERDIFFGVGLRPNPDDFGDSSTPAMYKRGGDNDIIALPGLWADIDFKHSVHQSGNLPPTKKDAIDLLYNNGFNPSLIISSGHGLHAYWLFKELYNIENDQDRSFIKGLNHRLQKAIALKAAANGWTVDSVYDLSRILRVPTTLNCKTTNPIAVLIEESNPTDVYNPEDLDEILPEILDDNGVAVQEKLPCNAKDAVKKVGNLVFSPDATPPAAKLNYLLAEYPKFKATWQADRDSSEYSNTSLAGTKVSASEMDYSLAWFAMRENWTSQEVANLIIAFRRKHGFDLKKAMRTTYIPIILTKIRKRLDRQEADNVLDNEGSIVGTEYETTNARESLLRSISTMLGVSIKRIVKFEQEPPTFLIQTNDGKEVQLGTAKNLIKPHLLQEHLADIGVFVTYNKKEWSKWAQKMLDVCEIKPMGEDATNVGIIKQWVSQYINTKNKGLSPDEAMPSKLPFMHPLTKQWNIDPERFHQWLITAKGPTAQLTIKDVRERLRRMDAIPSQTVVYKNADGMTKRGRMWALPSVINKVIDDDDYDTSNIF